VEKVEDKNLHACNKSLELQEGTYSTIGKLAFQGHYTHILSFSFKFGKFTLEKSSRQRKGITK